MSTAARDLIGQGHLSANSSSELWRMNQWARKRTRAVVCHGPGLRLGQNAGDARDAAAEHGAGNRRESRHVGRTEDQQTQTDSGEGEQGDEELAPTALPDAALWCSAPDSLLQDDQRTRNQAPEQEVPSGAVPETDEPPGNEDVEGATGHGSLGGRPAQAGIDVIT